MENVENEDRCDKDRYRYIESKEPRQSPVQQLLPIQLPQGYPMRRSQDDVSHTPSETQNRPIDDIQCRPRLRQKGIINIKNIFFVLLVVSNIILAGVLMHYYYKAREFFDEKSELEEDIDDLRNVYNKQISKYNRLDESYESLNNDYTKLQQDFSNLDEKYDNLLSDYNSLDKDFSELQVKNGKLSDELGSLQVNYTDLQNLFENLTKQYDILNDNHNLLEKDYGLLSTTYSLLMNDYESLQDNYTELQGENDELLSDYDLLQSNYGILQGNYNTLEDDYNNLQQDYDDLIEYYYNQTEVLRRERKLYHEYISYLSWPEYADYYYFYVEWELSSYFDSLRRSHTIDWDDFDSVNKYLENKDSFYWSVLRNTYPNSEDLANAILDIVHKLEYRLDPTGIEDVRYPWETLIEGCGDCEDVAILCAAILEGNGLDAVLIVWPTHLQAGVYLSTAPTTGSGTAWYIEHNSKNYYICECTGDYNWDVGDLPTKYQSQSIDYIYDV